MYILYYISESMQINTIEVQTLDAPVILPENLHFIALRKGIDFIDHPSECISFTHLERLCISSRLDDLSEFQNHPFRLKNSLFIATCQVDQPVIIPPIGPIVLFDDVVTISSTDFRDNKFYITLNVPFDVDYVEIINTKGEIPVNMTTLALSGYYSNGGFGSVGFDYATYHTEHTIDITELVGPAVFNEFQYISFVLYANQVAYNYNMFSSENGLRWVKL